MPKQAAIPGLRDAMKKKVTRREQFLAEMDVVVPWTRLLSLIAPHYPRLVRRADAHALDAVVTSHFLISISAYAAKVPCYTIYVNEKTPRFFEQIGRPERAVPAETCTGDDVDRILREASQAVWTDFDEQQLARLKAKAYSHVEVLDVVFPV